MPIELNTLDLNSIPKDFVLALIGRRRSGKTTAIMSILYHFRNNYDFGVVFCGSLATCEEFQRVFPPRFVHSSFDIKIIEQMIERQETRRKQGKNVERIILVLDDFAFAGKIFKTKAFQFLFFNGRHVKISLILSMQTALTIGPALRGNIDLVFAASEKNVAYRKRVFDHYSISFRDFNEFDRAFLTCTTNYGIMVLSSFGTGYDVRDNVFQFRARFPYPQFKMNVGGRWWGVQKKRKNLSVNLGFTIKNEEEKIPNQNKREKNISSKPKTEQILVKVQRKKMKKNYKIERPFF